MRALPPVLGLLLGIGCSLWAFAGSSLNTVDAVVGVLGATLLGLAVFGRVRRGPTGRGIAVLLGAQAVYLSLWIAGGLLWAGPPRNLPHFASPWRLTLAELQGRWTREDGRAYEVRGTSLRRVGPVKFQKSPPDEHSQQ